MFALEMCLGFVFCSVVILDWKNVFMWVLCVLKKKLNFFGKICFLLKIWFILKWILIPFHIQVGIPKEFMFYSSC
jgi:hypothetical protein